MRRGCLPGSPGPRRLVCPATAPPTLVLVTKHLPAVPLALRAVFVSNGDFYATTAVSRLGQSKHGVVRAGCACYTTADEVERLITGVEEIA
jgi:selenocysteine lyase/cysteine desulfurase